MSRPASKRAKAAEEAEFLRRYRLVTAFDADEVVNVDGVLINLACDVDKTIWRPICPLGLYGHPMALRGPEIVFPWTPGDWKDDCVSDRGAEIGFAYRLNWAPMANATQQSTERLSIFLSGNQSVRKLKSQLIIPDKSAASARASIDGHSEPDFR